MRRSLTALGVAAALAVGGCQSAPDPAAPPRAPVPWAAVPDQDAASGPAPTWENGATADASPQRPTHLRIPAIGVDTDVVDLAVDGTGALVPPESAAVAGWFAAGAAPGSVGPALLAGHVDSHAGPGVFWKLVDLRPGDAVEVGRADGSTARFRVTGTTQSPKAAFPTAEVYAPTPGPELRLVTCGGTFDRSVRSYRDNVIVSAVPDPGGTR
ncbi:class F sortase [Actinokineospora bangkokensis]|uniref:Class F sortase n=1 Tax=Actinokineospora bangkokensis TaxID=1193682 RepID=A0A1Q9LHN4_9PSEU|nr:class F sortase [Actinokineospora bangkokensis]OLR91551.1 hypothetical protein BJP25_25635 [Actinokineospora bangkokensis]